MRFDAPEMADVLFAATDATALDELPFGVIGIDEDDEVVVYNQAERDFAGLSLEAVIGKDLFAEVAPCMNNFMVAQRLDDEAAMDETIDYVLTLKMKPTNVKLRMIKSAEHDTRFILVKRA